MTCISESDDEDLLDDGNIPAVWKQIIPLLDRDGANQEKLKLMTDKWYACIYIPPSTNSKRKADAPQLIFGRVTPTLFLMENGYHKLQINCCKPYDLEGKPGTVEEYSRRMEFQSVRHNRLGNQKH